MKDAPAAGTGAPFSESEMARIIGAIATSHTPTIGFALDANKQADPLWKPIFDSYAPIAAWFWLWRFRKSASSIFAVTSSGRRSAAAR